MTRNLLMTCEIYHKTIESLRPNQDIVMINFKMKLFNISKIPKFTDILIE